MKNLAFAAAGTLAVVATYPAPVAADPMGPSIYAGVFGGAILYDGHVDWSDGSSYSVHNGTLGSAGLLFGVRLQQDDWFYGGEVDGDLSFGQVRTTSGDGCAAFAEWCDHVASAHARGIVGRNVNGVDIFASAGLAVAAVKIADAQSGVTATLTGYSLGLGAEFDVNQHLALRVEGLHDRFGDHAIHSPAYNGKWSQNTVRAAAIFHFN
jgi:opacity protein-like surface antigen